MMDRCSSDLVQGLKDAKNKMFSHLPTQPSMTSTLVVLVAFIVLTSDSAAAFKMHPHPAAFVARGTRDDSRYDNGMADVKKREFVNALFNKENKCKYQASPCNPFKSECCNGMKCLNYSRGYCRYGVEPCICYPEHANDVY